MKSISKIQVSAFKTLLLTQYIKIFDVEVKTQHDNSDGRYT